ncbi:MAG: hypothetical protein ACYCSP_16155 [Acidobacteriaceae bacterium]
MKIDDYMKLTDEIRVVYRALPIEGFSGHVVGIGDGEPGPREIIVAREGANLVDAGAVGVRENLAVFSVRRGDSWVGVPLPLTLEEASVKALRNAANQAKRIQQKVPLFAEQIQPTPIDPENGLRDNAKLGTDRETLKRHHNQAVEATFLR